MKLSDLAKARWKNPRDQRIAVAVALAESGGKVDAHNDKNSDGSEDFGLWQINSIHGYDSARLLSDPEYNADAAYAVWQSQGWRAWTVYKTGAYLAHLGRDAEVKTGGGSNVGGAILGAIPGFGVGGIVSDLIDVPNPADGLDAIGDTVNALSNPSTWLRLGKGALGGIIIIVGVGSLVFIVANKASNTGVARAVTGAASPVSKATRAVKSAT